MIIDSGRQITPYFENGKPLENRINNLKIAGWHNETQSGSSVSIPNTYNDFANVVVEGKSTQVVTVASKNLFDSNKFVAAMKTQGYTTLGVNTDGSIFANGIFANEAKIYIPVEGFKSNTAYTISYNINFVTYTNAGVMWIFSFVYTDGTFGSAETSLSTLRGLCSSDTQKTIKHIICSRQYSGNVILSNTQLELGTVATAYTPFTPNSPSPDYPCPINSVVGFNANSSNGAKNSTVNFPSTYPIRSLLNGVKDTIVVDSVASNHNKLIDKQLLDLVAWDSYTFIGVRDKTNLFSFSLLVANPLNDATISNAISTILPTTSYNSILNNDVEGVAIKGGKAYFAVSKQNTGISQTIVPSLAEIKAYFYGYKMVNADGSYPYMRSEVPYNPTTWAEWSKPVGVVGDSAGVEFTTDGITAKILDINTNIKISTNYVILLNVVSNTLSANLNLGSTNSPFADTNLVTTTKTGNIKLIKMSKSSFSANYLRLYTVANNLSGEKIKIQKFSVLESPAGSQIEADFTNLTADQLSLKYPFNGLCTKNWIKQDGTGSKVTVCPTVQIGTPVELNYELATPIVTVLPYTPIKTHYQNTVISTDSTMQPNMIATVKVSDI